MIMLLIKNSVLAIFSLWAMALYASDSLNKELEEADVVETDLRQTQAPTWIDINSAKEQWPQLDMPLLSLGDRFIFDPFKAVIPHPFTMMKYEVSCYQMLHSGVLSSLRKQTLNALCEFDMNEAVTGVSFNEAKQYCQSFKARLPTEAQWVWAASHASKGWLQDHGILKGANKAVKDNFAAYKVPVNEAISGPFGVQGLYGNVWEMTADKWGSNNMQQIIKGGAFDLAESAWLMHPYYRAAFNRDDIHNQNVGFRCIK